MRLKFAIQVQLDFRYQEGSSPIGLAVRPEIAEQIRHGCRPQKLSRAERHPAYGSQLLLELAGHACINRQVS
jgi:hypothetical protein